MQRVGNHMRGIPMEGDVVDFVPGLGLIPPNITIRIGEVEREVNYLDVPTTGLKVIKEVPGQIRGHYRLESPEGHVFRSVQRRHLEFNRIKSIIKDLQNSE